MKFFFFFLKECKLKKQKINTIQRTTVTIDSSGGLAGEVNRHFCKLQEVVQKF